MTSPLFSAALACLAMAVAALVALTCRRWPHIRRAGVDAFPRLPVILRVAHPLATVLEPLATSALTESRLFRTSRQLESVGLSASISAIRWEALRVSVAAMFGLVPICAGAGLGWLAGVVAAGGYLWTGSWLARQRQIQEQRVARELPMWLDLMTVCVEAGASLTAGLRLIVEQAPASPLRDYFERVLREVRGGRGRSQAFSYVADIFGIESLHTLASALGHAEASGMSLGQVLRAQAQQRTAERFARAEKLAMQAPVKMLGPLILCIFPCTFIVIGVPIAVRLREALGT
jgi:tight adherence protein C